MKINRDLADATMMLSFISLVLIGTSDFADKGIQYAIMGGIAFISIAAVLLRIVDARKNPDK